MEVVKTRLAVSHPGTYSGIANCARTIIKYEGVRALYNGLRASNLGIIPYAGVGAYFAIMDLSKKMLFVLCFPKWHSDHAYFLSLLCYTIDLAVYGTLKAKWKREHVDAEPAWYDLLLMGSISSFTGQICAYPLQLVRTRMQSSGLPGKL